MMHKYKELIDSPLFNVSLASRELFHSNLWAWIINKEKNNTFLSFISSIKDFKQVQVYREKLNIDLLLDIDGKLIVVENKIKSLPNKQQLLMYQNKLGKKFYKGIIISLLKPSFELPKGWCYISYREIIDVISKINFENDYYNLLIKDYCKMINNICDIMDDFINSTKNTLYYDYSNLELIKFEDTCRKLKANQFVDYLYDELALSHNAINEKSVYNFDIYSDYSNKKSIINIAYTIKKDKAKESRIGIQIEGNQYRRFVAKFNSDESFDDIFETYLNLDWFEKYSVLEKKVFNHITGIRNKNGYCKYFGSGKNSYKFVYQYYYINDYTFDSLFKTIKDDIRIIEELLQKEGIKK